MSRAPGGGMTRWDDVGNVHWTRIVILVDLFWLVAFISTGIFYVCVLFKEPVKPHFMPACTVDFIAVVYDFPFLLTNHAQNLNSLAHTQ
jgi:hypothetical protein